MAFPTVVDADTKSGTVAANSTSWTLTYPTNLAAGDLVLAFMGLDGGPTPTFPAGWVRDVNFGNNAASLSFAKKSSDGTETGNFTVTLSATESGGWRVFRITGWEGTLGTAFANGATSSAVVMTGNFGASANPDPAVCDPNNWGVEDTLWFAAVGIDTSRTISVFPYATRQSSDVSGGSTGATLGVCSTTNAAASENPGTFTISASDDWATATVAVRPAAAAAVTSLPASPVRPYRRHLRGR